MNRFSLTEFLETQGTQKSLADALGVQQSAVSQMFRSGRNIEIIVHADGKIEANEIRPVPARPRNQSAA